MTQTADTGRRPIPLTIWWYALLVIAGVAAAVASFFYLRDLAEHTGWTDGRAWLLPLSLDALAAAALTRWAYRRDILSAAVSVGVVVASGTGNALSHLYGTEHWQPTAPVIVAVGVMPVVAFMLIAHLWSDLWTSPDTAAETEPAAADTASTTGTGHGSGSASSSATPTRRSRSAAAAGSRGSRRSSSPRRTDEDLVQTLLASPEWLSLSGDALANQLHVAKGRALSIRKMARARAGNGSSVGASS